MEIRILTPEEEQLRERKKFPQILTQSAKTGGKDDWGTPLDLWHQLDELYVFSIDGAANGQNALLSRWWGPGGVLEDALTADWSNERVFCNPPYSMVKQFIAKAAEERKRGAFSVLLVASRTDTRWWHDHVWDAERHTWRTGVWGQLVKGRLKFRGPTKGSNAATFPSAIIVFVPDHEPVVRSAA